MTFGQFVENLLLSVESSESEEEQDTTDESEQSTSDVVPHEKRVVGKRGRELDRELMKQRWSRGRELAQWTSCSWEPW